MKWQTVLVVLVAAAAVKASAAAEPPDPRILTAIIDKRIEAHWLESKVRPAATVDDATFLRRVSLDLMGRIPTVAETRAFLADQRADKRALLVDRLLSERVKALSATVDQSFSSLLADLKERGLLDSTLIVCMGEFGRTPKINDRTGRDHWPRSWSVVLAGGAIKGGQAIGRTSPDGTEIEELPAAMPDLMATICKVVGIDHTKQNVSNVGRPIRIANVGAKPIEGIL